MDDSKVVNIADQLQRVAWERPHSLAVVAQHKKDEMGRTSYTHLTFRQLWDESDFIANGLESVSITRGTKTVLMVNPSPSFFALVFALLKIGAIPVIIDPGIGTIAIGDAINEVAPEAFIGIPKAHFARVLLGWSRSTIKKLVTVGKKWIWGGHSLSELRELGSASGNYETARTKENETAAILFTSGSTGIPKGAVYTHGIFSQQVRYLKEVYGIKPGERDLSTFPLFALFAPALGMTSVIPDMNPSKPAAANPKKLISAIEDFGTTNMFASPAIINKLGRYGESENIFLPSLKRVISAGAPARLDSLARFSNLINEETDIFTPYGATEALPVCNIGSRKLLSETKELTDMGKGACIGTPNPGITLKVIRITDTPIYKWTDKLQLPDGEIGELVVKGPIVTAEYYNRPESTALAKIYDKNGFYHRMGDLGYKDENGIFWFCGRKSHRVITEHGTLFTVNCEAVFNTHPDVYRTALVGIPVPVKTNKTAYDSTIVLSERQSQDLTTVLSEKRQKKSSANLPVPTLSKPVICIELENKKSDPEKVIQELKHIASQHEHTKNINTFLIHPSFPVDIRHNAKIFREKLALWAKENAK